MYMPVLKSKQGEMKALGTTDQAGMHPLIDLLGLPPREPSQAENPRPVVGIRERIYNLAEELAAAWKSGPLRIDFSDFVVVHEADDFSGESAASVFSDDAQNSGLTIIPVTGIERTADYQVMVRDVHRQHSQGVAFRITAEQFGRADLAKEITAMVALQDLRRPDVDIVFDAGDVSREDLDALAGTLSQAVALLQASAIGRLGASWRSVTVASAAWPSQSPQGTIAGQEFAVPRKDWALFLQLLPALPRDAWYGDYGIESGKPLTGSTAFQFFSNIRYTLTDSWLFIRGKSNREDGGAAYFKDVCAQLILKQEFSGVPFSAGDAYLEARTHAGGSSGGPTQWREALFSHHFAMVMEQLRTLAGQVLDDDLPGDSELPF